jgi:hypothetical protein
VELAKSRARRDRWLEEVTLTSEEMRRNIAFGRWQHQRWVHLASSASNEDPVLQEGLASYALERAAYEAKLLDVLTTKWRPVIQQCLRRPLLARELLDPFVYTPTDITFTQNTASESSSTSTTADITATLHLAIQASTGLALSTDDLEYEPT